MVAALVFCRIMLFLLIALIVLGYIFFGLCIYNNYKENSKTQLKEHKNIEEKETSV